MSEERWPLLIPGARGAGTFEVQAPWDRSSIGVVETADEAGLETALATARACHEGGALPVPERLAILERAARLLEERKETLAVEAAREGGKPLVDSRVEATRAVETVRSAAETLRQQAGTCVPMGITAASSGRLAFTRHEPIGVVAAVSAFNHPLNLIAHQLAPAVATGCPVIAKPASETPLSCLRFAKILAEAGLPEGWCQLLATDRIDVAEGLVTDERVAFFSFIGSAGVGWSLRSKLAPGTRCALEHGGAAPVVVEADADLDDAVPRLAKGGFYHAGQVCVSVQRLFAAGAIAVPLAERLADAARALRVGDPTSPETEVGPLIRPREVERVANWVAEAVEGGAKLLCGGERLSETCFSPTVLLDPPLDARVMREEIFGPVVCVRTVESTDEAIALANDVPWSFQAALFTRDLDRALHIATRLNGSAIMVNDHTAFRVDWMPFAGLGRSGHGVGGVPYTMHEMQHERMIVLRSPALE